MIIATEKKTYVDIALTQDEVETLKYAWTIIAEIGNALGDKAKVWVASETGELVEADEFARVLGILSAFAEQEVWESEG